MADKENKDVDPDKMKVKDLRQYLRERGEYISGNKTELVQRAKGTIDLDRKTLAEIQKNDSLDSRQTDARRFTTPCGENLQHPMTLKGDWTSDVECVPSFSEKDLYNFLVLNRNRTFDNEQMKANRALKAKVYFKDGHVHSILHHPISKSCSHCYVKAKVMPSVTTQKESQRPDYNVWLCLSKVSGQVHSAGCDCTAGALISAFDKAKKKYQGKLKKLESQMQSLTERYESQIRMLKQRLARQEEKTRVTNETSL